MAKYYVTREQRDAAPLDIQPALGDVSYPAVRLFSSIGRGGNMLSRYGLPLAQ